MSCDITKVKLLINEDNVDNVLDEASNYTAFHYAVSFQYTPIIKYLLSLNADYDMKDSENRTVFDMSNDSIKKIILNNVTDQLFNANEEINDISHELNDVNKDLNKTKLSKDNLESELKSKKLEIDNLTKKINQLKDNINKLQKEYNDLVIINNEKTEEVKKYKKRNLDAEQAVSNLLKKQRKE